MAPDLNTTQLRKAFDGSAAGISDNIVRAADGHPELNGLFNEISAYVVQLKGGEGAVEPATKKRKIEGDVPIHANGNGASGNGVTIDEKNEVAQLAVAEISTVLPLRKKFTLEFTRSTIRARDPKTNEVVSGTGMPWRDVEYVFLLPVPEKAQKQYNYVLLPKSNTPHDPLVFTIPHTPPKAGTITGPNAGPAAAVSDEYKTLMNWVLKACLPKNITIIESDEKHFASALRQPARPGEKAVHVKAFRGSKDGYLFFLPNGILWAFKKPLLFLPKERIQSVSYTSVLQRTFNLNVEYVEDGNEEEKLEVEFAMLDQEDYEGIGKYVARHGLADASLAEQRRAKKFEVNKIKDEDGNVVGVEEGGELAKAGFAEPQEGIQGLMDEDEEDSEGEDYDPGSEGESEGSGSSSEEESDGEGGEDGEDDEDEDEDGEDEEDL